jgi:proteic killer suppression protein
MRIQNIQHKGLKRLYEDGSARGLPAAVVEKLENMLAVLDDMEHTDELRVMTSWKAHQLTGDRAGTWSFFVTRNWRLTFWIDEEQPAICDLNLEDYH